MRVEGKLRRIADESMKAVVTVTGLHQDDELFDITNVSGGASSGLLVADNSVRYLILTDSTDIEHAERIAVTLPDGTVVDADFQKRDPVTGLGIVSVPKDSISGMARNGLSMAVLGNSYQLKQGESLLAVGAPFGSVGSYACGRIVSLEDSVKIVDGEYRLVTTDIPGVSTGSGVLVNMNGEVVGMIAPGYAGTEGCCVTAVPISPIKPLIEKLSNNAPLSYIGIHGMDITDKAAEIQDIPSGVYVSSVDEDSPALQEGIQPGDIITSAGLSSAVTLRSLHENIMSRSPGDTVEVTVMRPGSSGYKEFAFRITIGELPDDVYAGEKSGRAAGDSRQTDGEDDVEAAESADVRAEKSEEPAAGEAEDADSSVQSEKTGAEEKAS